MSTIAQKQLAFLEETVNHYNSNNRCVGTRDEDGLVTCKYSPVTLKLEGKSEGCAIGRKVSPEIAVNMDTVGGAVGSTVIQEFLPAELKELGIDFLYHVQRLHDTEYFWDSQGINAAGLSEVQRIKNKFSL